jgi:hypothetical protein
MDLVRKEHERLTKRLKASQNIKNVQDTIDLIQAARDTIASGSCLFVRRSAAIWSFSSVY